MRPRPIHTVYGGAHLFKAETPVKLAALARKSFDEHAPDGPSLARALGGELDEATAAAVHERVRARLGAAGAVQDYRIDFEDGYGYRPDLEEDAHAAQAAEQVATAFAAEALPPWIGIRIKSLSGSCRGRAERTLRIFLTALLARTGNRLPPGFLVTLPKIKREREIADLCAILGELEAAHALAPGALKLELMIETPESIQDGAGRCPLPDWFHAAQQRCFAAHFGAYDYTAAYGVTASEQDLGHPACDHARQAMQAALSRTEVNLSDGATTVMPVGDANDVHAAWRLSYRDIRRSLRQGFYQGWDLHPAQIPIRYVAVYAFFQESLPSSTARLKSFMDRAAQATLAGSQFDDAATGQGLVNYFLRGLACGALGEDQVQAAGLSAAELRTRSFQEILERRASPKP